MHRIGQYKIGLTEIGMASLCDVLKIGDDPVASFQEYAEVVGDDLNQMPIEAGFPNATWRWDRPMTQEDFNTLLGYFASASGTVIYIQTRNNVGGSASDYTVYAARMKRPTGTHVTGMWEEVEVQFVALEIP